MALLHTTSGTISAGALYINCHLARGQRWLQKGIASYVAGGWRANYLFQIRSGQPYNLNVGGDVANISGSNGSVTNYSRPNVIGNPHQGTCGSTPIGKRGP